MVFRIECESGNRIFETMLEAREYIKKLDHSVPYTIERVYFGRNANHLPLGREWAVKYSPETGVTVNPNPKVPLQKGLANLGKLYQKNVDSLMKA